MASPVLLSFCCARDSYLLPYMDENLTFHRHVLRLSSDGHLEFLIYNALCLASSVIGTFGAVYQLFNRKAKFCRYRYEVDQAIRTVLEHNDVLMWLTTADLLASLGMSQAE